MTAEAPNLTAPVSPPWPGYTRSFERTLTRFAQFTCFVGLIMVSMLVFRVGGTFTLGDFILLASLGLTLLLPPARWLPAVRPSPQLIGLVLTCVGGLFAITVSTQPTDSALVLARVIYLAFLLPWQFKILLPRETDVLRAYWALGSGAALCGAATVLQLLVGPDVIPGTEATNADRFPGLASHVSDTGGITCIAVIVGVGLFGALHSRKAQLAAIIMATGGLLGAILSGSVSGMLAVAVGLLFLILARGLSRAKLALLSAAGAAVAIIGSILISQTEFGLSPLERLSQVLGLSGTSVGQNTSGSRWETIKIGWSEFGQHPWTGVGLDPSRVAVLEDLPVHNLPVGLLYAGGLLFAAGICLSLCVVAARSLSIIYLSKLGPTTLGVVAAAACFAMTAPSPYNRYLWVPLAIAAVVSAANNGERSNRLHAERQADSYTET